MEKNKYQQRLAELEDNCITNVEEAFNLYLLRDLEETAGVEGLFTDLDWYLFWIEKGRDINNLINELIQESASKEELIRAIKIKRIVDFNLLKLNKVEHEIIVDLDLDADSVSYRFIRIKPEGKEKMKFLESFYRQLREDGLISQTFNSFNSNFDPSMETIKINWLGTLKGLLGLLKLLANKKVLYLEQRTLAHIVSDHFLIGNTKPNFKSAGVMSSTADDSEKSHVPYMAIVKELI